MVHLLHGLKLNRRPELISVGQQQPASPWPNCATLDSLRRPDLDPGAPHGLVEIMTGGEKPATITSYVEDRIL